MAIASSTGVAGSGVTVNYEMQGLSSNSCDQSSMSDAMQMSNGADEGAFNANNSSAMQAD